MPGSVIVGGARTPIGKLAGSLKDFTAMDLGGFAIKSALERAGITGDQVDYVIMGHVIQAGAGQNTARQAAVKGGIPMSVPSLTVNKVCLSGLNAIATADQLIGYGEFDVVVAGGMESMTQGPYLLPKARGGYRYGNGEIVDSTAHDALFCSFDQLGMGAATETYTKLRGISRDEQDAFSAASHERAAAAQKNGLFDNEIVAGGGAAAQGRPRAGHRRRRGPSGHHGDDAGEAAPGVRRGRHGDRRLVVADLRRRGRGGGDVPGQGRGTGSADPGRDRRARHRRRAGSVAAVPAGQRDRQGARTGRTSRLTRSICSRSTRRSPSVAIQSMRELEIGEDVVNVNGGAIAMGHPVGASGARLALHLALELKRRGGGIGAAGSVRRRRSGRGLDHPRRGLTTTGRVLLELLRHSAVILISLMVLPGRWACVFRPG